MWDCIIIGGGPAGLTAATYLGRFERDVLLVDAGESRLQHIPLTRNTPGFPEGIAGPELLARLQDQASRYGALFRAGRIEGLKAVGQGFRVSLAGQSVDGRTVLLATGAKLIEPSIANLEQGLKQGRIRYCPICDGYEARGQRIAVLGGRCGAIGEAHFLRTFSDRVTYLHQDAGALSDDEKAAAAAAGIVIVAPSVGTIQIEDAIHIVDQRGEAHTFDVLYPCLGCDPQNDLAVEAGARCALEGGVLVDAHQRTNVAGLYAAGDVLQGLDQIASACGQGAIAAVAMHNDLAHREVHD